MSGFRNDIISILRHNNLLHKKSIGLFYGSDVDTRIKEVVRELIAYGYLVSAIDENIVWDYIVIPTKIVDAEKVLRALSLISAGGIVILEVTEEQRKYQEKYLRVGTNMSATKVQYEDRYYLILHTGDNYGN